MLENDKDKLNKILEYCKKIEEILSKHNNSKEEYENNFEFQLSTDMCIYQIGEISVHVSEEFKKKHLECPWAAMKAMRNIHAHDYEIVDRKIMWDTLTKDIPDLEAKIKEIV